MAPRTAPETLRERVVSNLKKTLRVDDNRQSNDLGELETLEDHRALIELVDYLLQNPKKIALASKVIQRANFGDSQKQNTDRPADDSTPWPEQYTSWDKIPKYWLWSLIMKKYPNVLTTEGIERIESEDSKAVRKILTRITGLKPSTPLDPVLHNKKVMLKFINHLLETRKHIFRDFAKHIDLATGAIDWQAGGSIAPVAPVTKDRKVNAIYACGQKVNPMRLHS